MQLGHAMWWVLVGMHADKPCAYSEEGMLSFGSGVCWLLIG